jgi:two-component sensor histidine kinase
VSRNSSASSRRKYGALAQPAGRLEVTWRIEDQPECRAIVDWRERNVRMPSNDAPRRKGYGTELIERALRYQLKAKTKLEFGRDGVHCTIEVPIAVGREVEHG